MSMVIKLPGCCQKKRTTSSRQGTGDSTSRNLHFNQLVSKKKIILFNMGQQREEPTTTLYLFGDQTFDVEPHLHKLLVAKNTNVVLKDFLDKTYDALRLQIFQLPKAVREELPRFTGIEDVLLWKRSDGSSCCVPLDMAITCMYQLGSFLMR